MSSYGRTPPKPTAASPARAVAEVKALHCTLQCNIIYVWLSSNYFSYGYDMEQDDYIR
jgi:hypothetical protein